MRAKLSIEKPWQSHGVGTKQFIELATPAAAEGDAAEGRPTSDDDLYDMAVAIVLRDRKASTSYIQRRLQIGYNRAATLMERMEQEGIVGQANHAGKREILIPEEPERF